MFVNLRIKWKQFSRTDPYVQDEGIIFVGVYCMC